MTSQKRLRRQLASAALRFGGLASAKRSAYKHRTEKRCLHLQASIILHKCASTRRFAATFLQAGKYRGKLLALCKTLVSRTCSLEAAHSFLSDAVLNFCSTVHRVHYTAGIYAVLRDHACTLCAAPSFSLLLLFACFSCITSFRALLLDLALLTSTLYYMLHYTARAPYCVATHALPPVSEVSQFRLSVVVFFVAMT